MQHANTVLNKEIEDLKGQIQGLKGQAKDEMASLEMEESSFLRGQPGRREKDQAAEKHRQDELAELEKDQISAYKEEAMKITKDELWQQVKYFKFLNQTYLKTVEHKENELAQCNGQQAPLNQKVETLRVQFQQLKSRKDEAARMAMERKPLLAEPSFRQEKSQVAVKGKPEETTRSGPEKARMMVDETPRKILQGESVEFFRKRDDQLSRPSLLKKIIREKLMSYGQGPKTTALLWPDRSWHLFGNGPMARLFKRLAA